MVMMSLAIMIIIVFILVSRYGVESMSPAGYGQRDINDHRRIYFHYTTWCKFCKLWRPIIDDAKIATRGSNIEFIEVNEEIAKTPYIQFFPSIYMLTEHGHRLQYKGTPNLDQFVRWCASPKPID
jgi:hypothetical protein